MKARSKAVAATAAAAATIVFTSVHILSKAPSPSKLQEPRLLNDPSLTTTLIPSAPASRYLIQCPPASIHLPGPFFHPAQAINPRLFSLPEEKQAPPCRPPTPLFITFASNGCLLEQTVLSYIAEGWPSSQIVVVDNSGMSRENLQGHLTTANHTFLNYTLLLQSYGVGVYRSPVRQSFAQLQNMLLELARECDWHDFYTSHQDVIVRSATGLSFFHRILKHQEQLREDPNWAFYFFHYDWLAQVNVDAAKEIGPWDILIPWYPSDCDYYTRTRIKGFEIFDYYAGDIYDVSSCLPNADRMLLLPPANSSEYRQVQDALADMAVSKRTARTGRNTWQGRELTGISDDYGERFQEIVTAGRRSYRMKWGSNRCDPTSRGQSFWIWLKSSIVWQ